MFNASFNAAETLDADMSTPVQPIVQPMAQPSNKNLEGSNSVKHFMQFCDGTMIEIV